MRPPITAWATRAIVSAAVLGVAVSGGCSSSAGTLDRPATQEAVADAVAAEVSDVLSVDGEEVEVAASCPSGVEVRKGAEFECTVDLGEAGSLPVDVRMTDDEGTLDVRPTAAVVVPAAAAEELKAALKREFDRSFQVDCGDGGPRVRLPEDTFTCRARDKTSRRSVKVTVTDADGTLRFELSQPTGDDQSEGGEPTPSVEPGESLTLELTPESTTTTEATTTTTR